MERNGRRGEDKEGARAERREHHIHSVTPLSLVRCSVGAPRTRSAFHLPCMQWLLSKLDKLFVESVESIACDLLNVQCI